MISLLISLLVLLVGYFVYGKVVEKVFAPDDRKTPAFEHRDGVDYVPMKKWKNCLVNLLNSIRYEWLKAFLCDELVSILE